MKKQHTQLTRTVLLTFAGFGIGFSAIAATTVFSFEDGTPQGWAVNAADWASGFDSLAVASTHATAGSKSLQINFTGKSYKWGGLRANFADAGFLAAIQYGGKLILDLHVPEEAIGLQHLGFVIQQPDVSGDRNWQQVWYNVGGKTGDFTIELPFERLGSGAVNFHLGQNAAEGQPFTVFVDNLRVESNPPPTTNPDPIRLQSFEDGESQGWVVNSADWANGFATVEVAGEQATHGSKSLKITFAGQSYRWGAINNAISDPTFLQAIRYGGKFLFDLTIPEDSPGVQNLGFTFQQPDVQGALNWQQIWFTVAGQTGKFTIELPFTRGGQQPPTLHLGHNSTLDQNYTVFLDNLRVVPNPPPPQGVPVSVTTRLFSFEDGTTEGFDLNTQSWGNPFTALESVEANATDGTRSLRLDLSPASFQWGVYNLTVNRPEILSAISRGGTFYADLLVPEDAAGLQHFGFTLGQAGAASPKDWQQTWFFVGGKAGRYTVDLPFTRETEGAIAFHLGRNLTGTSDVTVHLDNVRVVTTEVVGAPAATLQASVGADRKLRLVYTGTLLAAAEAAGPYSEVTGARSPYPVDPTDARRFFRTSAKPLVFFSDDFEGADLGWTRKAEAGDSGATQWVKGTPEFTDEITFAHSGSKAWTTGLSGGYGESSATDLISPVIDLAGAPNARLSFYSLVDVGGVEGEADKAEVFVRNESGGVLAGAEAAVWSKSRVGKAPWFYGREVVDLPSAASGKKVRLEFRLTSDANASSQRGWFLDDVSVYAKP